MLPYLLFQAFNKPFWRSYTMAGAWTLTLELSSRGKETGQLQEALYPSPTFTA
jgi:hypothetical protein